MDLRCQVWKWVWKMQVFGLKWGQELENRPAHPREEFPGVLPPPPALRWFWSVLSSCMTTGRISINNASILVVHCLIGQLLSAALWLHYLFLLVGLYSFMFFFTSFFSQVWAWWNILGVNTWQPSYIYLQVTTRQYELVTPQSPKYWIECFTNLWLYWLNPLVGW